MGSSLESKIDDLGRDARRLIERIPASELRIMEGQLCFSGKGLHHFLQGVRELFPEKYALKGPEIADLRRAMLRVLPGEKGGAQ